MSRALDALIVLFVASLGLNWPALPGNAHLPELLFGPLVLLSAAVLIRERQTHAVSLTRLDLWVLAYLAGALPSLVATDDMRASLIELVRHAYLVAIYVTLAAVVVGGRQRAVGGGFRWSALVHAAFGLAATAMFAFGMPMPPDIGEVMRMPYVGDVLRLRALTFSPSMLGALLTATAPFVFVAALADDAGTGRAVGTCRCRRRCYDAADVQPHARRLPRGDPVRGLAAAVGAPAASSGRGECSGGSRHLLQSHAHRIGAFPVVCEAIRSTMRRRIRMPSAAGRRR